MTSNLHAPYAFVPLSTWVYEPEWADEVSHDTPFEDGWSGHLDIEIEATTPLLIGGKRSKPDGEDGPTKVEPFLLPNEKFAIPGSSLRGMFRNVLQAAAFGRIGPWMDDRNTESNKGKSTTDEERTRLTAHACLPAKAKPDGTAKPDLADLIFGHVSDGSQSKGAEAVNSALKGRVSFEVATLISEAKRLRPVLTVLLEPQPAFYRAYLKQPLSPAGNRLQNPEEGFAKYFKEPKSKVPEIKNPQIAGWKFFPAYGDSDIEKMDKQAKSHIILEPLAAGAKFKQRIWFHNLKEQELGALLWVLTWGGQVGSRHRCGMGRPYGLGEIEVGLVGINMEPNGISGSKVTLEGEETCEGVKPYIKAFVAIMNNALKRDSSTDSHAWENSDQIRSLLAMANPKVGEKVHALEKRKNSPVGLDYMDSNSFEAAKEANLVFPPYPRDGWAKGESAVDIDDEKVVILEDTPPGAKTVSVRDRYDNEDELPAGQLRRGEIEEGASERKPR